MRAFPLAVVSLFLCTPLCAQEQEPPGTDEATPTRIHGNLLGADGSPMEVAHVHLQSLSSPASDPIASVQAGLVGVWSMETDSTGVFLLWFTGVDHLGQQTRLLLHEDFDEMVVDARLGPHDYLDDFSDVVLIGDFNEFEFQAGALPMQAREDGTYALELEVEADTLAYQIFQVAGTRSTNGTMSDRYSYDGGGDYRSVVDVRDGAVEIVFDPDRLMRTEAETEVRFRDEESVPARYATFAKDLTDRSNALFTLRREREEAGATREELQQLFEDYDASADLEELEAFLTSTGDPEIRGILYVTYLTGSLKTDSLAAREALAEIPPGAGAWTIAPQAMTRAVFSTRQPDEYEGYVMAALRENVSENLRADLLMYLLHKAVQDEDEARRDLVYAWLVSEYPESFQTRSARSRFDPDRAVQPGRPIPEFQVASLEDSTVTYSNGSLLGDIYLLDFWAVWCGPCIGEMEYLHQAHEKYAEDGLRILSVSFDRKLEDVAEFRAEGEWPMPWMHAFAQSGFGSEVAKDFGIIGIPTVILVGEDGNIRATSETLRGEHLDRTLADVFGREPDAADETIEVTEDSADQTDEPAEGES